MKRIIALITLVPILVIGNPLTKEQIEVLNNTASCDSTCFVNIDKIDNKSGYEQKLTNCGYGYSGTYIQERKRDEVRGQWSNWSDRTRESCICTPLLEEQEVACPTNQRGTHMQTRDWICPSLNLGEYNSWRTKSNTCAYYMVELKTVEETIACPTNQRGTKRVRRVYELWSDNSLRNDTGEVVLSNTCDYYVTQANVQTTTNESCSAHGKYLLGYITYATIGDIYSDGSVRNQRSKRFVSQSCEFPPSISTVITKSCVAQPFQSSVCKGVNVPITIYFTGARTMTSYYDDQYNQLYLVMMGLPVSFNINPILQHPGSCPYPYATYSGYSLEIANNISFNIDYQSRTGTTSMASRSPEDTVSANAGVSCYGW